MKLSAEAGAIPKCRQHSSSPIVPASPKTPMIRSSLKRLVPSNGGHTTVETSPDADEPNVHHIPPGARFLASIR
jgi:hypothetical protein